MKHSFLIALAAGLAGIGLTGGTTASATSYTNTIAQITAYITSNMAAQNVQGMSIALVDNQTVVWATGFGNANNEQGVAANADTVYHVGSVSKAFLGTAFMQLRDQVQVDIETNLTHYIPEFSMLPRFASSGPVTIRSLLNHHSGIPADFFNGMTTLQVRDDYADWLIKCLQGDYPFAPVNERSSYCNSAFAILTEVAHRITGTDFAAFNDAMIFTPMGMDASSFLPDKPAIASRMATAYNAAGEPQPPEIWNAFGSGSMYSSANDLSKYIRMILADGRWQGQSIVSSNGIDVMTTPQLTNLPLNVTDNPQGLGWDDVSDKRLRYAGKFFWKDGATWYHCAYLGISRDRKLGVAVIQNSPGSLCDTIGLEALRWAVLEKTSIHWPTNTFVPVFSPVTNRPQSEIEALAGLYVGNSGYNKVAAETGSLTVTLNAYFDAPDIISNIVPRANGWFSKTNSQDGQLAFTNLGGHAMLVLHQVDGAFETVAPLGEYYVPGTLSAVWRARTNCVYRMVDMHPGDYFWYPGQNMPKTLRFQTKDGALMTSWMLGMLVIEPQNDNLAFQRGTHYRKSGAVQVNVTNGFELLQYSSYRFLDEAAIPTLPVPALVNGSIPFADGTQWYWFTGQSGITYRVRLNAPGREFFVRLTDREGIVLSSGTNTPATLTCPSNGTYAIAVSATNTFAFSLNLAVCGLRQSQGDYDGDQKADPAAYQSAIAQWRVALSGSGYAIQAAPVGGPGDMDCAADYDGDGKTDLAVYNPAAGLLTVLASSQSYAPATAPIGGIGFVPAIGDFDGDRKADPAAYSATRSQLSMLLSGSGYTAANIPLGGAGWLNACEDFDGDGKTDPAVYAAASGQWQLLLSGSGYMPALVTIAGGAGNVPVAGDYDGDGKADSMIYQSAGGVWLCALSSQGYAMGGLTGFGGLTMTPRPGDYDNDGRTDPALYDSATRIFYVMLSGTNYQTVSLPL